jgi:hypothetical protein
VASVEEVQVALGRGSLADVTQVLDAEGARTWRADDRNALAIALTNRTPENRLAIASWLLDQGVDATFVLGADNVGALHILFSHEPHDYEGEAVLAARLIEAGADVNLVSPRFGSPLAILAAAFKFSDATLQPLYGALFDSGKLVLSTVDKGGRTMMENVAVKVKKRAALYDQLVELAQASGQQAAIPEGDA